MDGLLNKLAIVPFADTDGLLPLGPPFVAQYNPESYTDSVELDYQSTAATGDTAGEAKFRGIRPKVFTFELILDGTGAAQLPGPVRVSAATGIPPTGLLVTAQVELFRHTVGFNGALHRPPFLRLFWGRLIELTVLERWSVTYTMFNSAGLPLRARLTASFRQHVSKAAKELTKNLSSPDVAHAHEVRAGDHLTRLSQQVYDDPGRYIDIAQANGLNTVRRLPIGQAVYMPPLGEAP